MPKRGSERKNGGGGRRETARDNREIEKRERKKERERERHMILSKEEHRVK